MRTPAVINSFINLAEIRHSLKTNNKRLAQKLSIFIYHRLDIIFTQLSQKDIDLQAIDAIRTLIRHYIVEAIKEYSELETLRHEAISFVDSDGKKYKGHTPQAIDRELSILSDIIMDFDPQQINEKAEEILPRTNISKTQIEPFSEYDRNIFNAELLKGETEILLLDKRRNHERINGGELLKREQQHATAVSHQAVAKMVQEYTQAVIQPKPSEIKPLNLFSEKMQVYIENESVSRGWRRKTVDKIQHVLSMAIEIMGDKSLEQYTREDFERFRSILQNLPSNVNKKAELQGKSLVEIAEANAKSKKYQPLKVLSINTLIGQLHTFLEWCIPHGYIQTNPTAKLKMRDTRKKIEQKDPFKDVNFTETRTKIYSDVKKLYANKPERVWVPMIGFYQGMRLEEIAQLHVEDIYQTDSGLWVFDLNENPSSNGEVIKHIKNLPSIRVVPIHPKLIEFGFLDYYHNVKKAGHERVFYRLKHGRDGFGRGVADWFNTQTKRHISNNAKKSFHSSRHTFIQYLKNLSVDEHKVTGLAGHGEEKMAYNQYGEVFSPEILLAELVKVEYPEFEVLLRELKTI